MVDVQQSFFKDPEARILISIFLFDPNNNEILNNRYMCSLYNCVELVLANVHFG